MKKLFLLLVVVGICSSACTGEDNRCTNTDAQICITDIVLSDTFTKDSGVLDGGMDAEEESLCSTGETISFEGAKSVSGARISVDFGKVKKANSKDAGSTGSGMHEPGPAEKTQFDVILKNGGINNNIISDENGEFVVEITSEELEKLPEYFDIIFTITPPDGFNETIKVNKNLLSFYKYNITNFRFILSFYDGYFMVNPKEQLNKLPVKKADAKKALDAFITATTKAVMTEKSEPVPGAEIIIDKPANPPKKDKKKSLFFSEDQKDGDVIVHCFEFDVLSTITTNANNEGYFSFRIEDPKNRDVLITINPNKDFVYKYDAASFLINLPETDSDIYDLMLTFEKNEELFGHFIIVGPIHYQPCSELNNPTCRETKCKMVGGGVGKCQYLYDSSTGKYKCGCFPEVCSADCTGNCKTPEGKEGICHIESIMVEYNGAEVFDKRCVCGPIDIECNMNCNDNQDCINQTAGQFPLCRTDMYGNSFCTQSCQSAADCKDPFDLCVKMGEERGVCICPCVNADNVQAHCSPIGMYNQHCNNITFGSLTDCVDINNDSLGECSLCCLDDKDCPEGLHCYNLPYPLNDKCTKACMCKEPPRPNLCVECQSDSDCGPNESCVDEDNNPNTPKVCSVPCGLMGICPTSPVYTYCDSSISKYCLCRHPTVKIDCNYECNDNQDCITNSNGEFDLCMPDMYGVKRCTKSCLDAKECPSDYSMCIQYGDKSYCACPCIHFDTDNVSCNQQGFNIPQCITKTNNSLPDCFDVDNDGVGECTHCCNDNKECPENMICTPVQNAKCDKVCTCKEHPIADVCQKCSSDQECPQGFVCADDDNNANTPNVCTRVCPSIYPCPTSPVYTYCDNNISKYCICNDSGINLCETKCETNNDCPSGFICADDDVNPNTPKICTKPCGDCPSPMLCNNNANLPVPVCMCLRDYCKSCKDNNECGIGFECIDSDNDPLTPKVCTRSCSSDYECPLNLKCNPDTKSCDCNRCDKYSNPECRSDTCYQDGLFGKCQIVDNICDCITGGGTQVMCGECNNDLDCQSPLKCVDADNNPATPNICSEPCPNNGCPSPSICEYNISKYCFCK
ncbi:MAG: hypothetical protein ACP5QK_02410 [Myxococcota bacterium]